MKPEGDFAAHEHHESCRVGLARLFMQRNSAFIFQGFMWFTPDALDRREGESTIGVSIVRPPVSRGEALKSNARRSTPPKSLVSAAMQDRKK